MRYSLLFFGLSVIFTASVCGQNANNAGIAGNTATQDQVIGQSWAGVSQESVGEFGCCPEACCEQPKAFELRGWIDAGYIWNTGDPASRFNGPYNAVDRSNEPMLNQLYLIGERHLPGDGLGVGGRVDLLYGEDYFLAESIGMEKRQDGSAHWNSQYYGLALPQAYVALGNERVSLQMGHFYSVVGYEGVMSPDNFFYSKAYSYQFAGPFTHWGVQSNFKMNQSWNLQLGLTNGWDALDRVSDDVGFVGKVRYDNPTSEMWTSFALTTGKEFNNSAGLPIVDEFTNRTRYSWLLGVPIRCNNEYVFHGWSGTQDEGSLNGERAEWYGIDQYLYHTFNACWKAGLRFEWFRDDDGTRVGLNRPNNPNKPPFIGNFYSASFGINYRATEKLVFRPDVRFDWFDGAPTPPDDDGNENSQTMFGFDAV
jgi:hypothetical protein